LLRENIDLYGVALIGYCLMSNHVHLMGEPGDGQGEPGDGNPGTDRGTRGREPGDGQDDTSAGPERIGANIPFILSR
jgi:hypothetical protein